MNLRMQHLFKRLRNQAGEHGSDEGGTNSGTANAIDSLGLQTEEKPAAEPIEGDEPTETGSQATDESGEQGGSSEEPADPRAKIMALMDSIGETPKPEGDEKPEDATNSEAVKPDQQPAAAKDGEPASELDKEEAEALAGVKSERGRERIQKVFAERRQLEQDVTEFKSLVQSSGMSAQEFAQTLEFGRLVNSGDEANIRVAIEMLEAQREALYSKLGVEAPGIDLLKGHPDLQQAVENMEMTRERAAELAKFRKTEQDQAAQRKAQKEAQDRQQEFTTKVTAAAEKMESYLRTRANEVDHPARLKALHQHFSNPANLQQFVNTYTPDQWETTLRMMYDNIRVAQAPAPRRDTPQPLRSRPASLGIPQPNAQAPIERLAQRIDAMGI